MTDPREPYEPWASLPPVTALAPRAGSFERIARSARRRRRARAAATGAAVLVVLAGVTGLIVAVQEPPTGIGNQPSYSTSPSTPAPTSAPPSSTPTTRAASGRCTASQVRVSVVAGDSAAGHIGLRVVFTSSSGQTCTLRGYPVVVFVTAAAGSQVNQPAQEAPGPLATVTLAPAGTAHADLLLVNVNNYPPTSCKPQAVAGVRVRLPGDSSTAYASSPQQICSVSGTGRAQVYPIVR